MEPDVQKNDAHWKLCVFLLSSLLCFLLVSNIACVHMWYQDRQTQKSSYTKEDDQSIISIQKDADPVDDHELLPAKSGEHVVPTNLPNDNKEENCYE